MTRSSSSFPFRFVLPALAVVALVGCELVGGFLGKSSEERLVEVVKSEWASPGGRLVGGEYGGDTIASVESTGERSWRVTIPTEEALGDARAWELAVEEVEVYRVFPGEEFARFLTEEATSLDRRAGLPRDAWLLLADGEILAVGTVQARVSRTDRSGSARVERVAFLRPGPEDDSHWTLEPETRTPLRLRDAVRLVYGEMIRSDDRVLTCMGSADPADVPRKTQLDCVNEVLNEEFGSE